VGRRLRLTIEEIMDSKTDNREIEAKELAIDDYQHRINRVLTEIEKAWIRYGVSAGWNAHAAAQADPWVRVDGRKENLPIREKVYWVTRRNGRVEKWQYSRNDNTVWREEVIAWMPDDPPSPYTDPRAGGADDE
jgi:hypothetical protein